jgi:exodeoxyribonuclease VII large subunit
MKNILSRRYPLCEILIYPSLVQGPDAPAQLCDGIRYFNRKKNVDTIIIGRGGGSIEDLWAFNSESLAFEIFHSEIPVISAVGHETDFTICDFVADLRAPTPSAAAELAVPDTAEVLNILSGFSSELKHLAVRKISECKNELNRVSAHKMFREPIYYTDKLKERISRYILSFDSSIKRHTQIKKSELSQRASKLSALSPLSVISRGYSIVSSNDGKTLSDAKKLNIGDEINIRFAKGKAKATVTDIQKGGK